MNKIYFTLFTMFFCSLLLWGQTTVTYDFSSGTAVTGLGQAPPGISLDSNIGFGSFKNSGSSNPALNSGQLRLYQNSTKGGSIKIYASNGVTITSVKVNASGSAGTGPAKYSIDGGSGTSVIYTSGAYLMSSLTATDNVEFYCTGNSTSTRIYVDSFEVTYTSGSSPSLSADTSSINNLDYDFDNGPSESEFVSVNGTNLDGSDVTITAPSNFEVSLDGTTYTSSITIQDGGSYYFSGGLSTYIFVRLNAGLSINTYSGDLTISGGGASSISVALSGEVTMPPVPCAELFFSEYLEGSSNNKALEIYNPTDQTVTLDNYHLALYTNGGTSPSNSSFTNGAQVAPYSTYVVYNSLADASLQSQGDASSGATAYSGNDAIALVKDGNIIDVIGDIGSSANFGVDVQMYRNANVQSGNTTYTPTEWTELSAYAYTEFGSHTSDCFVPAPGPSISASSCGSTISLIHYDAISATSYPNATNYEFKIGTNTKESATGSVTLGQILPTTAAFNTTYQISVRAYANGSWTSYGPECSISTSSAPVTEIQNYTCGSTVPGMSANIYFKNGYNVEMYEYEITPAGGSALPTVQTTNRFVKFSDFSGVQFATSYTIKARMKHGGTWGSWSADCVLNTPVPVTQLRPTYCNGTIAGKRTPIYARGLLGATEYKFEVSDGNQTAEITRTITAFHLEQQSTFPINFGATYTVRVAAKINNTWGAYGSVCNVTVGAGSVLRQTPVYEDRDIKAYPNPFSTTFKLEIKGNAEVGIYNMLGREMERHSIKEGQSPDMGRTLPQGMYVVRVTQEGKEVQTLQVIKK